MKQVFVIVMLIGATLGWSDEPPQREGADFLSMWEAWNHSDAYKYTDFALEYRRETRNWDGRRKVSRKILRYGKGDPNPFEMLEQMREIKRLRDVRPFAERQETFSMILPNAIRLQEQDRIEILLNAEVFCQLWQGRPRRFIIQASPPRSWKTKVVRLIFTWDLYEFDEEEFWLPVEAMTEYLVERGPRQVLFSERWTLKHILGMIRVELGSLQEIDEME
jgi:hypothetical protein